MPPLFQSEISDLKFEIKKHCLATTAAPKRVDNVQHSQWASLAHSLIRSTRSVESLSSFPFQSRFYLSAHIYNVASHRVLLAPGATPTCRGCFPGALP